MATLKGTNTHPNGHMGQDFAKSMVELYSKNLVRAIGKVFLMNIN